MGVLSEGLIKYLTGEYDVELVRRLAVDNQGTAVCMVVSDRGQGGGQGPAESSQLPPHSMMLNRHQEP